MNPILPTLVQIAKGYAYYQEYNQGNLWYRLHFCTEDGQEHDLKFPIPVIDAGDGAFTFQMKGIHVQRWARKQVEFIQKAIDEARMP